MTNWKKLLFVGYIILLGAIIVNMIWIALGMNTWHTVIELMSMNGFTILFDEGFNLLFLFGLYPLSLAALALWADTKL